MSEKAYNHKVLNETIDDLSFNQFNSFSSNNVKLKILEANIRKCIWLCSILANSKDEAHQKKVQLFSSLLFLQYKDNVSYVQSVYVLFSRIGNLTATRFLDLLFDQDDDLANKKFNYSFGESLDLEVALARGKSIISIFDKSYLTTKFQKSLWENLDSVKNLAISAPTSSGKSFIIKKFVQHQFNNNANYRVLYIVPSKALINQVGEELRMELDPSEVDIKTAYLSPDLFIENSTKTKEILVLTPERCLKLLQRGWEHKIHIDFVFVDEIQNLEDEQGRGTLFEFVLKEISILAPNARLVSAGPNIHLPGNLFKSVFGQDGLENETLLSPVFQMMAVVKPGKGKKIIVGLTSRVGNEQVLDIETDFDLSKEFKKSMGDGLSKLVGLFGKNEQNIIYSPQPNLVEAWALLYAKNKLSKPLEVSPRIREIIDFLKEEIHPKYYLITCLTAGIAFHHSKLPDIVRKEIEDAFSDGYIKDLYCTSTLIEGVNLPANNLFVISPRKKNIPLSKFEFGNLIGRAGRIKDSLFGTIFCVVREGEDWQEQYLNMEYQKIVVPASDKALVNEDSMLAYLSLPISQIPEGINSNTVILLRQKFLRSKDELENTLQLKGITPLFRRQIIEILGSSLEALEIPSEILRLNPSVDPFLQNDLYNRIKNDGIDSWCIDTKIRKSFTKEEAIKTSFQEKNLYWQLVDVMLRLDPIFGIWKESAVKNSISISIPQMCIYSLRWMENKSYGELIEKELNYLVSIGKLNRENDDEVNNRISRLIKIYSNVVSFICVKYLKLLVDIMASLMTEQEKDKHKFALAFPTYLELGTSDPIVMQLISRGVSRSVAIKVFKSFKRVYNSNDIDVFGWLKTQSSLPIKPIYNRYLRRLRLLKDDKIVP